MSHGLRKMLIDDGALALVGALKVALMPQHYFGGEPESGEGEEDKEYLGPAVGKEILGHQRMDGDEKGSWDPIGPWGRDGGRIYSTALGVLCAEVHHRSSHVFGLR